MKRVICTSKLNLGEDLNTEFHDWLFQICDNCLEDADYYLDQYRNGDESEIESGTCSPNSVYQSIMKSNDVWEYASNDIIYVRNKIWNDPDKYSDWLKKYVNEVYKEAVDESIENGFDYIADWWNLILKYRTTA